MKIRSFSGYRVNPTAVAEVVAPAYDSVSAAERYLFCVEHPLNFVNTMRTPDEFPAAKRPSYAELLRTNRRQLEQMLDDGSFIELDQPAMFLYRLAVDDHQQIGLVCAVPVAEYESGIVRKHENTRSDKEDLLAGYLEVVAAVSSPICLAYQQNPAIDQLIDKQTTVEPILDFVAADGVSQTVWLLAADAQQQLTDLFAEIPISYLTDGHHRAASGSRYAALKRSANDPDDDDPSQQLLAVLFPHDQLRVMPYNRCICDLNGLTKDEFLTALELNCNVQLIGSWNRDRISPETPGQFCDKGHSYLSALFVATAEERALAEKSRQQVVAMFPDQTVVTPILEASEFYPIAGDEIYHQNYYKTHPVRYKTYRWQCGRDSRLRDIWGEQATH